MNKKTDNKSFQERLANLAFVFLSQMDDPAWEKLDWKTYGRGAAFGMSKKSKRKTRRKPD